MRGDVVYNEKVDIFSLGMLLYELTTDGKQPFNDLKFRSELDEAVVSGRPLDPIVVTGSPPWPDMQDLLDHMLEAEPEKRPTADQVRTRKKRTTCCKFSTGVNSIVLHPVNNVVNKVVQP